jgi:hypothetical protein
MIINKPSQKSGVFANSMFFVAFLSAASVMAANRRLVGKTAYVRLETGVAMKKAR